MFKPIVVIPFFNHGTALKKIAPELKNIQLPILLVNDGSDKENTRILKDLCKTHGFLYEENKKNGGKGAAVRTGLNWAIKNGYTHALQIDADGQHNLKDVPDFLKLAKESPNNIICGHPVYDDKAPKSRLYGRKVTNFWVWIETGGRLKTDTMCGFRIYPLSLMKDILPIIWFNRMGFDIEILVKSFLNKIPITEKSTKVAYQPDGVSHFRPFKDNVEISCVHTCLCVYSIWKLLTGWK
ncbi:MAG: glycosyltransferase family 2 protein [Alphaproteobacteria bacterium]|nr:glycosyltransferase family 2 protein [Alphaproteobacteria bacterium]